MEKNKKKNFSCTKIVLIGISFMINSYQCSLHKIYFLKSRVAPSAIAKKNVEIKSKIAFSEKAKK